MNFKNIVLAGGGVLGSQIAYQSAYKGFNVTVWVRSEASIGRSKPKFQMWHDAYVKELNDLKPLCGTNPPVFSRGLVDDVASLTPAKIDELIKAADDALTNIRFETDMAAAVADADLVIEAVAENPEEKIAFYSEIAKHMPEKTVIVTNSSTLLPSMFAKYTGRPEKYLSLHFANQIWSHNTAEVMGHPGTDQKYFDQVVEFAESIGMFALPLKKEQPGYILNSLLVPFLNSAMALLANDVAEPAVVDKTWMLATGAPMGPFRILDVVGITTAYNIVSMNPDAKNPDSTYGKIATKLKAMIDAGKTGVNAGEGFYKYN
ncbi:MAG: 3-hydroxyacyl-CoA dehydrogenase [Lachnospiraceae bacterium]|nr:3-hydroxyacyl-CoA dehydrogenase [Lachnospiraceae bacterium]